MKKCNLKKVEDFTEEWEGDDMLIEVSPIGKDCQYFKNGDCLCKGECDFQELSSGIYVRIRKKNKDLVTECAVKEFKGNVAVLISDKEVRVWACNEKGMCVFRLSRRQSL